MHSMSDFRPKPGSFIAYLEYAQRDKPSRPPAVASPLGLLEILERQEKQSLPIGDLQMLSGMDPVRYRDALKDLRGQGWVDVDGPALDEVVRLTEKGGDVARLARTA
jgi:hypothetical protein